MARRTLRHALTALLALASFTVGLASTHDAASAEEPAAASRAVTTVLHPGWNMVGWLGPDAPVSDLFEAIPALESVAAWDAEKHRYLWALAGGSGADGLHELRTGMGLWMRLGGDVVVEWEQAPANDYVLLELRAGRNLVGWTGRDTEKLQTVARQLGPAFVRASRWDAETGRQLGQSAVAPFAPHALYALNPGDALWVDMSDDVRWWQSGAGRTVFEFPASVSEDQRATLYTDLADVVAFFAEHYGIEPPGFTVAVDPDADVYAGVLGSRLILSESALHSEGLRFVLAHEYFHVLQSSLEGRTPRAGAPSPAWLTEGAAVFAESLYEAGRWDGSARGIRGRWWELSKDVAQPLQELESGAAFYDIGSPAYGLGALAIEWLVGKGAAAASGAGFDPLAPHWAIGVFDGAHLRYHRLLASADSWEDAFESAFNISPREFYVMFERYREESVPLLPHLVDGVVQPVVVSLGRVPAYLIERIQAEVEAIHAFMIERFGSRPTEYSVLIGPYEEFTEQSVRFSEGAPQVDAARRHTLGVTV